MNCPEEYDGQLKLPPERMPVHVAFLHAVETQPTTRVINESNAVSKALNKPLLPDSSETS